MVGAGGDRTEVMERQPSASSYCPFGIGNSPSAVQTPGGLLIAGEDGGFLVDGDGTVSERPKVRNVQGAKLCSFQSRVVAYTAFPAGQRSYVSTVTEES